MAGHPEKAPIAARIFIVAFAASIILGIAHPARAASLFFSPDTSAVSVGQTFAVSVDVDSGGQSVNAASADISFPSNELQVVSVSQQSSIINLWVSDPSFSNSLSGGSVDLQGIVLNPGFTGNQGNLVTIRFQALAPGSAPLSFNSGSVLANDGNGTNVLTDMEPTVITISPAGSGPTVLTQPAGPPPAPATLGTLKIKELSTSDPTNSQPLFRWNVSGGGTPVYLVKIGSGDWFSAAIIAVQGTPGEYRLPLQAPTLSTPLSVEALDPAGDMATATVSFSVSPIPTPTIVDFTRTIPSSHQLFSASGGAPSGTIVHVYLQGLNRIVSYTAQTASDGQWSLAGDAAMTPGNWQMFAQAVDARGALSQLTQEYPVHVNSALEDLLPRIIEWAVIALVLVLALGAIVFAALAVVHRIRRWRIASDKELIELEARLREDIARIEKDMPKRPDQGGPPPPTS